jgi:hypothetical protein
MPSSGRSGRRAAGRAGAAAVAAASLALAAATLAALAPTEPASPVVHPLAAVAPAAVAVAAVAPGGPPAGPAAEVSARQAPALVAAYNLRPFGNPGWRRVRLDLKSADAVTRSFTVVNVWSRQERVVRTLFALEQPEKLRGTDYLLIEDPAEPSGMRVYLHLPAGRRGVLRIQPNAFGEGLLGSDFGYRDLRMGIPTAGCRLALGGRRTLGGEAVQVVDSVPEAAALREVSPWGRTRYYLAESAPVLLGADYFTGADDARPAKQLRVLGYRRIDGAWTETRMVMSGQERRSSVLTLLDFKASVPYAPELFAPAALPSAGARLGALRLGSFAPGAAR